MQNNNKYLQTAAIVNASMYEDEDGNTKYNYGVFAKVWDNKTRRYTLKSFLITSTNEYDLKDAIKIKANKSRSTGEIYFTEVDPLDLLPISEAKIEDNDELPFVN